MPGLNQLKKFSEDITALGNESEVRAQRGEPFTVVPLPQGISEVDDSDDFIFGLPNQEQEEAPSVEEPPEEDYSSDLADLMGMPKASTDSDSSANPIDLDPDLQALFANQNNNQENNEPSFSMPEEEPDLSSLEDFNLDSFNLQNNENSVSNDTPKEEEPTVNNIEDIALPNTEEDKNAVLNEIEAAPYSLSDEKTEDTESTQDDDFGSYDNLIDMQPDIDFEEDSDIETSTDPNLNILKELSNLEPQNLSEFSNESGFETLDNQETTEPESSEPFNEIDNFSYNQNDVPETPDISEIVDEPQIDEPEIPNLDDFSSNITDIPSDTIPDIADDILPDITDDTEAQEQPDLSALQDVNFDTTNEDSSINTQIPDIDEELSNFNSNTNEETTSDDIQLSDIDSFPEQESTTEESIDPIDTASIDALASLDNIDTTDGALANSNVDDSISTDSLDFDIPGFITDTNDFAIKPPNTSKKTQKNDTEQPPNTLSDTDYKTFLQNLNEYPLNLRIAIEELIVNNEFTDDAVFQVIEKILKKASARQVAGHLQKHLDIFIDVPRDYERRTAEQYESYKSSLEYQLKNRIIPAIIIGVVGFFLISGITFLSKKYIVEPWLAEDLYKEGYELILNDLYPQSEEKFIQAVNHKAKKKWFFRYAQAYREKKQYDRAATTYKKLLTRFDHDKIAGLEYAHMELDDLENYARTEEIIKREILDYHINDSDAMLLLGDTYLEWATEKDPAMYEKAFAQYQDCVKVHGNSDEYTKRFLRYYIRTDNLTQVLPLKEYFMEEKKKLGASDLVELSEYLMLKQFGQLKPEEEYLRTYIVDVRALLERALKADPSVPEAYYNYARYFIHGDNYTAAQDILNAAIEKFDQAEIRKPKRIKKHIDTYRLLGEIYSENQEYLLAEETYAKGISLFEKENSHSAFPSNKDIGHLYADMADLDYFISGDLDQALLNYQNATKNLYKIPSVDYKIGYIQYNKKDYEKALSSFVQTATNSNEDRNLLFSLANTLSLRNDNFAAQGYYERLIDLLDLEKAKIGLLLPQIREDQAEFVDLYMKTSNNLGVTLSRLATTTGDSSLNAKSIMHLSESLRAWDAMTRNQDTMVRLDGSNLASININYLTHPKLNLEPAIYTTIPRVLYREKILEQSSVK